MTYEEHRTYFDTLAPAESPAPMDPYPPDPTPPLPAPDPVPPQPDPAPGPPIPEPQPEPIPPVPGPDPFPPLQPVTRVPEGTVVMNRGPVGTDRVAAVAADPEWAAWTAGPQPEPQSQPQPQSQSQPQSQPEAAPWADGPIPPAALESEAGRYDDSFEVGHHNHPTMSASARLGRRHAHASAGRHRRPGRLRRVVGAGH